MSAFGGLSDSLASEDGPAALPGRGFQRDRL